MADDNIQEQQAKPGITERVAQKAMDKIREWSADQPSFTGQLDSMWREGLKDLQNAILPAFPDSQRGVEEPGTPLNPTPQQVTQDLGNFHGYEQMLDSYSPSRTPVVQKETELER